jgi:tetratricopeptide (TPR) repeat protein
MLSDIGRALSEQQIESEDQARIAIQNLFGDSARGLDFRKESRPLQQAQDLIYSAWEEDSGPKRVKLAHEALRLSRDCADAYVLLADESVVTPHEQLQLYRDGVAAGERALEPEGLDRDAGAFWGAIETRPYMRARSGLATCLWDLGRREEAIEVQRQSLQLNPNDNQGLRYTMLAWLLEVGRMNEVRALLDQYDERTASWQYGEALYAYRVEGPASPKARSALKLAKQANRFVPSYLLRNKPMPEELPDSTGFGDESEAICCAFEQALAWTVTAGALEWLAKK